MPENPSARGSHFHEEDDYVQEEIYRFSMGVVAGVTGVTFQFPIDTLKSLVQSQNSTYTSSSRFHYGGGYYDTAIKIFKYDGWRRFYQGLLPQCAIVGPEKAVKLSVNDFIRIRYADETGKTPLKGQFIASITAGIMQTIFTTPGELLKVRGQLDQRSSGQTGLRGAVLRDIYNKEGIRGLYRGQTATLAREMTFSPVFFMTYQYLKEQLAEPDGSVSSFNIALAGFLAGLPATSLPTPFDMIKTRMQADPKSPIYVAGNVFTAGYKILRQEGFKALWKGTLGRAAAGSCQFAVTILMYEELKLLGKYFGYDYDDQDAQNFKKVVDCKKCNYYDKTHLVKNPLPDHGLPLTGEKLARMLRERHLAQKYGLEYPIMRKISEELEKPLDNLEKTTEEDENIKNIELTEVEK